MMVLCSQQGDRQHAHQKVGRDALSLNWYKTKIAFHHWNTSKYIQEYRKQGPSKVNDMITKE